jgi:hypothetical protein
MPASGGLNAKKSGPSLFALSDARERKGADRKAACAYIHVRRANPDIVIIAWQHLVLLFKLSETLMPDRTDKC